MSGADSDWLLEILLDIVSNTGREQPLTVFCGGFAVSGTAIREEEYFERLGGNLFQELAVDSARLREDRQHRYVQIRAELDQSTLADDRRKALLDELQEMRRRFIVMRDVAIVGAGEQAFRAPVWRGRLSEVSGWIVGSIDDDGVTWDATAPGQTPNG